MAAPRTHQACPCDIGEVLSPAFFKALCDPTRIGLVGRLAECKGPCTVGEIAECCSIDLSVVSRHLAKLRDAGILRAEKRGKEVYYALDTECVARTLRAVADAIEACNPVDADKTRKPRTTRPKR